MNLNREIELLFDQQLSEWEQAHCNYEALNHIKIKEERVNGVPFKVQFNPARIVSSAAKVDSKSIMERRCFLCRENRPSVQRGIDFAGESEGYEILINPFPIFPKHLTIPDKTHTPQQIKGRYADMLALAESITDYVVFYNGPKCGASAPDHMHFQAGNKGFLSLETGLCVNGEVNDKLVKKENRIRCFDGGELYSISHIVPGTVLITGVNRDGLLNEFNRIYSLLPINDGEWEPMMNIVTWYDSNRWFSLIFLRRKHRPACYYSQNADNMLLSPASVDLGGVFITPLEKDFDILDGKMIESVLSEISADETFVKNLISKLNS